MDVFEFLRGYRESLMEEDENTSKDTNIVCDDEEEERD